MHLEERLALGWVHEKHMATVVLGCRKALVLVVLGNSLVLALTFGGLHLWQFS